MAGDFEPERDELGRFTSGGGGGATGGPKEWAKQGAKEATGGKGGASAKKWAAKDAKAATSAAMAASVGSERGNHGTDEKASLHLRAAEAHEAAAKAHREAGNERAAAAHEQRAINHREERSASLHTQATNQAENGAQGKGALEGKREWVGKQTNPEKMEFEGQFAGHGKQTVDDHFIGGKPTTARAQFHEREIIEPAFEGKKTAAELGQAKPVAILTMGGPASGKGVVLGKLHEHGVDQSTFVHVDPDEVKGKLPEYQAQVPKGGGKTFIGAAAQVHEESSFVAKQIRDRAIDAGHNVVIDGTGGNADKFIQMIDHLKAKGYDVQVHHPHLDVDEGVKRALARAERGGRHVPEKFIRETYENIERALPRIQEAAGSSYHRYDAKDGHRRV